MNKKQAREIVRTVIWRIAQDEGGQVLHYNDWVDDNWKELLNTPTIDGEQINKTGGKTKWQDYTKQNQTLEEK